MVAMVLVGLTTATTPCPRRQLPRPTGLALGATLAHSNAGRAAPPPGCPPTAAEHRWRGASTDSALPAASTVAARDGSGCKARRR